MLYININRPRHCTSKEDEPKIREMMKRLKERFTKDEMIAVSGFPASTVRKWYNDNMLPGPRYVRLLRKQFPDV